MSEVAIIAPVLRRPQNAIPLAESVIRSSALDWRLVFVCSAGDSEEIEACTHARELDDERIRVQILNVPPGPGDYARKIQAGYDNRFLTDCPFVLLGADDLRFHDGWDESAFGVISAYDVGVVGTNDLGNPAVLKSQHSTHPLVARCYIDRYGGYVGAPGQVYFDQYDHQFVDCELVETAKARGCYAHCHSSVVEHLHPFWRKGEHDDVYAKGQKRGGQDRRLFETRRLLWEPERVPA